MIMTAGTVRIMHQIMACDWQMLTVSIVDTPIWVAQLLGGGFAAAVNWLKATIAVQGLISCWGSAVLTALSAHLPPAESSHMQVCVQDSLWSARNASHLAACPADNTLQCIQAQEEASCIN